MRSRARLRVPAVLVAGVAVLAFVSGAWGLTGRGAPAGPGAQVAAFAIQLDSEQVTYATGYELGAAMVSADKKDAYKEYTLRISLALTENPGPAQAFQSGETLASAKIHLLSGSLAVLQTYELADATVVAYRQSGDVATNTFDQELVLKSRSLTISAP